MNINGIYALVAYSKRYEHDLQLSILHTELEGDLAEKDSTSEKTKI